MLELEHGEDIDLVSQALLREEEDPESVKRLLEQIKHRLSPLTLRTPGAVNTLAWAIEHRRANPAISLLFRYTTNAPVGIEVDSPLPEGIKGIEAWAQLRQGTAEDREAKLVAGIRAILRSVPQPADINDAVWTGLQTFLQEADDTRFLEFVRAFEWSPYTTGADALALQIQQELIERQYVAGAEHAEVLYDQLFVYVFKVLTQSGPKRLTRENLNQQLALPTLSDADRHLLARIKNRMEELETRLSGLEETTAELQGQIARITRLYEIKASIDYTVTTTTLALPPAVVHLSDRARTVADIYGSVQSHVWTALHGGTQMGKTQLGRLVAQAVGTLRGWLSFHNLTIPQAVARLDAAVRDLMGTQATGDYKTLYENLATQLSPGALLVFDDLPRLNGNDDLAIRLVYVTKACQAANARLLSLSAYPLPTQIHSVLAGNLLDERAIPPFSNEEIEHLLAAFDAPEPIRKSAVIQVLAGLTHGHPLLLVGAIRYLAQQDWQFTDETLHGLFGGTYTTELNPETMQRLLESTTTVRSRELLYRLSLSGRPLPTKDWQALAHVSPPIARPVEYLTPLIGLWIQQEGDAQVRVSPLVRPLADTELTALVQKRCHRVLGDQIVTRGRISVTDVIEAISHFVAAVEFNRAGALLILALNTYNDLEAPATQFGILDLWTSTPLPEEMELNLRLYVRALQIAVFHKQGRPVDYLLSDVDTLLHQTTKKDAWAVLALLIYAAVDTQHGNHYLLTLLRLWPDARLPDGTPLVLPTVLPPASLIWLNSYTIQTAKDLHDWLQTLAQLTQQDRERTFSGALAKEAGVVVADRLWMREGEKPPEQQNWPQILHELQAAVSQAQQLGGAHLWAAFTRAQIVVQAEYLHDLPAALAVATTALQAASGDPECTFLIAECIGRQFAYVQQDTEARQWLQQAIDQPTTSYPHWRMVTLLYLSKTWGRDDARTAVEYAQQAVDLALTGPLFPAIDWSLIEEEATRAQARTNHGKQREMSSQDLIEGERVKALGELAIAQWLAGDLKAAFQALDQAGERLLANRPDTMNWKDLFVIFGHVSGYLTAIAGTVEAPATTEDGVPYIAPTRGMFLTTHPDRFREYRPERAAFLPAQLALFAEATGQDERATYWAAQGIERARQTGQRDVVTLLSRLYVVALVQMDRYVDVLDLALETGPRLVEAGGIDPRSREGCRQAEEFASALALLPIALRLAFLALDNQEQAQTNANLVASRCRQIAAGACDPELWTGSADMLEQIFVDWRPAAELIQRSNQGAGGQHRVIQLIGYFGASVQADALPTTTIRSQALLLTSFYLRGLPLAIRRLMLPFLEIYWMRVLLRVPFRFRRAALLGDELRRLQQVPVEQRALRIVETVAHHLGVQISDLLR